MILEVRNIAKHFNGLKVLQDVSLSIPSATISSLFGENGSGKTTLFHILSGFLKPDSGSVYFNGKEIDKLTSVEIAKLGISRGWQTPRIFKNLSVLDNLLLATHNHPGEKVSNYFLHLKRILSFEQAQKARAGSISEQILLSGKLGKTGGSLSLGQQKLLSIGMLLMSEAELLFLDEPFAGVSGQMVDQISQTLKTLKESGKTIVIIEHNRAKAKEISDAVFFLVKGKIQKDEEIIK
jgi:ABC-type branched-subunit amino acid transport system ATPase component